MVYRRWWHRRRLVRVVDAQPRCAPATLQCLHRRNRFHPERVRPFFLTKMYTTVGRYQAISTSRISYFSPVAALKFLFIDLFFSNWNFVFGIRDEQVRWWCGNRGQVRSR